MASGEFITDVYLSTSSVMRRSRFRRHQQAYYDSSSSVMSGSLSITLVASPLLLQGSDRHGIFSPRPRVSLLHSFHSCANIVLLTQPAELHRIARCVSRSFPLIVTIDVSMSPSLVRAYFRTTLFSLPSSEISRGSVATLGLSLLPKWLTGPHLVSPSETYLDSVGSLSSAGLLDNEFRACN